MRALPSSRRRPRRAGSSRARSRSRSARRRARPRNITSTRSQSDTNSSSSVVISTMPTPARRDLVDDVADLGLGADVDADGRLVHDEHLRHGLQPFGEQHLLLVAAGKLTARVSADQAREHAGGRCCAPSSPPWLADRDVPAKPAKRARMGRQIFSDSVKSGRMPSRRRSPVISAYAGGKRRARVCPAGPVSLPR